MDAEIIAGSRWRNRKSGIVAEVVEAERDVVHLKHEKRATTLKWVDRLVEEYELLTDDSKTP